MEQQDALVVIKQSDLNLLKGLAATSPFVCENPTSAVSITTFPASEVFEAGFTKGGVWQSSPEDKRDVDLAIVETYTDYVKSKI